MNNMIGKMLDNRYELLEVIGSGGMAVVYKAKCHRLNRLVAVKVLKSDLAEDADFRRRFRDESQAVAMLSHPNIVSVYGVWKDTAVRLEGEAVRSLTLMFLQMWGMDEREPDTDSYGCYLNVPLRPLPGAGGYVLPYADSPLDDERVGECVYLDILNHAERYVRIFTPYLILDETMVMALTFAAKRGVDVELILPHVPDKKFAFALAKGHYRELLDAGVKIYEYTPGFVHAKVFVSDDRKAVVGTINLDYRSLYLHFEDAVYLYDCPCIKDIVADFDATRAQSQIVTHGDLARIPLHTRITSALLKLVAPLM